MGYVSRFVFPVFAMSVSVYMGAEQLLGNYRSTTSYYTLGLALPVLVFAVIQIGKEIWSIMRERSASGAAKGDSHQNAQNALWLSGFLVITVLTVVCMSTVGYLIAFSLFLLLAFYVMGLRRPSRLLLYTIGTMTVIYLVFVLWLATPLPAGILRGVL